MDLNRVYGVLREKALLNDLRKLREIPSFSSAFGLAFDWGLILAAWALIYYVSYWFFPLAIIVVGSRQRALGNLLHDAGHRTAWRIFLHKFFDAKIFITNAFGELFAMTWLERLLAIGWWTGFLLLFGLLAGFPAAFVFFLLWLAARFTVFHGITVFREISDHVGLVPGTVIGFTRNSPGGTLLSFWIHPHNNNYHLTHHIAPKVPFSRIKEAHRLLMNVPEYAVAHHCDGYFSGEKSVVACWVGRCLDWHRDSRGKAAMR